MTTITSRRALDKKALLALLNWELAAYDECEGCRFTAIRRFAAVMKRAATGPMRAVGPNALPMRRSGRVTGPPAGIPTG